MGGKNSVPHRPSCSVQGTSHSRANEESMKSGGAAFVVSQSKDQLGGRSFVEPSKRNFYNNASSCLSKCRADLECDKDVMIFPASSHTPPSVQKDHSTCFAELSLLDHDVEDSYPVYNPRASAAIPPPRTPKEPMEFLSRSSWNNMTMDMAQSFAPLSQQQSLGAARTPIGAANRSYQHCRSVDESTLERAAFSFASQMEQLGNLVPPSSYRRTFHKVRLPHSGISLGSWIKDRKHRKKEAARSQNAEVHAAIAIAGLAAGIAAVTAATAASATDESSTRTSIAVASAAALVAAQCVEVAERMGADRDHMAAVVSSAVNVRSAGDIMTLRASAATSLRGAATLRARRVMKEVRNLASVTPYDQRASSCDSSATTTVDEAESEAENSCQELLARGAEFLKRGKNGDLHWRTVYVYINKLGKVLVQLQSKHMRGILTLNQKSLVLQVYPNITAWPGRNLLENGEHRSYFALKTSRGTMEFECQKEEDHQLWTESISFLLYISSQRLLK